MTVRTNVRQDCDRRPLICQIVHRLDYGGLENGVINLVNGLPADKYRSAVLALTEVSEIRSRIWRPDVIVESLGKREGKDPAAYGRLWRWLRSRRPSIVHTRNLGTVDCQWVAFAAGVPVRIHGEHGWEASDPYGTNRKALQRRRWCRPAIRCFVPMSRDLERWLQQSLGLPPRSIRQIYNGVDTSRFCANPIGGWQSTGAQELALVVGTVGRLDPVKNQSLLVRAMGQILDRRPDWRGRLRLIIVGDGPARPQLLDLVNSLGLGRVVELLGARDDVPDLMRSMHVFALPSMNEGISNTILEAMASGLPVVASRTGGNPELVVDGVTGSLVPVADVQALSMSIEAYLADATLRRAHGLSGRARVEERFSLEAMMAQYCDLYDTLLREA